MLTATRDRKLLTALSSSAQGSAGGLYTEWTEINTIPFSASARTLFPIHAEKGNQVLMIY